MCKNWTTPILRKISAHHINTTFPQTWLSGILTLIRKSGPRNELKNYRPVTLLNTIYKIWATIITMRMTPIMSLLPTDNQCAYKAGKSTMDAIFCIKQQFIKNEIQWHISSVLSKAFDRINRNRLWWILYEKGIPPQLIRNIIQGHTGNILQGKHEGEPGMQILNKKVFSKEVELPHFYTLPMQPL